MIDQEQDRSIAKESKKRPNSSYEASEQAPEDVSKKDSRLSPAKEQALFTLDQVIRNAEQGMGRDFSLKDDEDVY